MHGSGRAPSRLRRATALPLLSLSLLIAGHALWLPLLGRFLTLPDPGAHAEAVVPLAGEPQRTVYASELIREGRAARLILTPLPVDGDAYERETMRIARAFGVPAASILHVPDAASSTYGEAVNVRAFAEAHGIDSLLVATSAWHTRRSAWIFASAFRGSAVEVHVVPVPARVYSLAGRAYRPERWWTYRTGRSVTFSEYAKLIAFALGVR